MEKELETLIVQTNDTNDKLDELITVNESSLVQQKDIADSISELNPTLEAILVKIAEDKHEKENKKEVEISKINGVETITLKGEKGEKGDTPIKGKDYFTDEEVKSFLNKITPVKGKDYFDGKQGPQGPEGKQGPQGPKGDPGINGRNGKDGEKGKDGSPDTPEQIVSKLNTLEKVVDWKVLKNVPDLFKKGGYGIGYLREISDVELTNLANNDTIKWDSAKNKWVNVADSGGGGTWGSITGTLSNQTDLQNALNLKYDASNPAGYITSSALSGYTPTSRTITINGTTQDLSSNRTWTIAVPTKTSDLTNDSGFITSSALSGYLKNNVGIAGGTTLIGGTASGNNLTLVSTSHATKGKILFGTSAYDEVNNRLGIGTNTPSAQVHIKGVSGVSNGLLVESPDANPSVRIHAGTTSVNRRPAIVFTNPNTEWAVGFNTSDNKFRIAQGGDLGTDASCAMAIDKTTYNFGIRVISPTAALHIRAGTASANTSPLKFTSGTNLTTPESGAVEYNGSDLFFTPSATRNILSQISGSTPLTAGSIPFATTGGYLTQDNSKLFWDNTNKRLGIGTNTPTRPLEIKSSDSNSIIARIENMSGAEFVWGISGGGYGIVSNVGTGDFVIRMTGDDNKFRFKSSGKFGIGVVNPTAYLHILAGSATANTAPIKLTTGTLNTTAEVGAIEYNNTFHLTNSDAIRRHVVTAPNATKVTASAPYTNDGYIIINIGGTDFKVMTTA